MKSKTMDMHILMACDIFLEKKNCKNVDEKLNYLGIATNAMAIFKEVAIFLNSKGYLFERRGLYSNPKTKLLIEDIQNATI